MVTVIELTVRQNESQFQLTRRALVIFARLAGLSASEQLAFADQFCPENMNRPDYRLEWTNPKSDPSPNDSRKVKIAEFNSVRGQKATFSLSAQQIAYLKSKTTGSLKKPFFSYGIFNDSPWNPYFSFNGNGGTGKSEVIQEVKNVEYPSELKRSLQLFETEAFNFATRFINDAMVRQDYIKQTKLMSEEILTSFIKNEIRAKDGAEMAHRLRDEIMQASRLRTSDIGRADAERYKAGTKPFSYFEEKYAQEVFKKSFSSLTAQERNAIWLKIVERSGSPNPGFTAKSIRLDRLGVYCDCGL